MRLFLLALLYPLVADADRALAVTVDESAGAAAPFSIDTADRLLAGAYERALADGDSAGREAIAQAFVDHVADAADHYRDVAIARTGADVSHVLRLHASALTANRLAALLDRLAKMGFRFVSLDEALKDPVYTRKDEYVGPTKMSWLYRFGPADPDALSWDNGRARALGERFGVANEGLSETKALRIDRDLLVRPVAPKTLVIVHEKPFAANSLVAETADGTLLLAGSPYTPDATRRLLGWLKARYGERKIIGVATHFHFDAAGGIAAWTSAGARVISSDLTAAALARAKGTMWRGMVGFVGDQPEQAKLFQGLEIPPPTETFPAETGLTLNLGEPVELRFPGPGHTRDNIVVWFPERRVLFGGCLVIGMPKMGYTGDADLASWPTTITGLKPLGATVIIPGHGERFGADLLDHTLAVIRAYQSPR